jgi:ubiquinone biosynthesis protein Coq4
LPYFTLTAVVLNTALFAPAQKYERMDAIAAGWQLGRRARNLVGFDWRRHLETPLAELRRELGLHGGAG